VVENGFVVTLLAALIGISTGQFVLRNFFSSGFIWAEAASRMLVLWLGLGGALLASRRGKHIRIDILTAYFSVIWQRRIQVLVSLLSAAVCLTLAWLGSDMAWMERQYASPGIAWLPLWVLQLVIPFAFTVLGIRYLAQAWYGSRPETVP